MLSKKVKYEDCLVEMQHVVYFLKNHIPIEKFKTMNHEELYKEYERYRVISIQDGWGYYSKIWKDKI